jgi:hypothetical protein
MRDDHSLPNIEWACGAKQRKPTRNISPITCRRLARTQRTQRHPEFRGNVERAQQPEPMLLEDAADAGL